MIIYLPMQEMWVLSLCREDTLEKEMATHSSSLAGKSRGQRSLAAYIQSMGSQKSQIWPSK